MNECFPTGIKCHPRNWPSRNLNAGCPSQNLDSGCPSRNLDSMCPSILGLCNLNNNNINGLGFYAPSNPFAVFGLWNLLVQTVISCPMTSTHTHTHSCTEHSQVLEAIRVVHSYWHIFA